MLDILDVDPANGLSATWSLEGSVLDIQLTATKDTNLQGNPISITFDIKDDGVSGTEGSLTFDIKSAIVGGVWESNDQANYIISDMIKHGNPHTE